MNTKTPIRVSPEPRLLSRVRPENWDARNGSAWDWDEIHNDWFIYTVDRLDGFSSRSVQLLANRDGSYILIHSVRFLRETGVFTLEQRRTIEDLFDRKNLEAYRCDGLQGYDRSLTRERPVLRNALWIVPGRKPGGACWGEAKLSPTTQHLISTFDQLLSTLHGEIPNLSALSILSN